MQIGDVVTVSFNGSDEFPMTILSIMGEHALCWAPPLGGTTFSIALKDMKFVRSTQPFHSYPGSPLTNG